MLYTKLILSNLSCIPFLFILAGIIESIWGLGQLYGVVLSRHDQFLLTGSFDNPGPYSGFLATIFPIAFYEWLRRHPFACMEQRECHNANVVEKAILRNCFQIFPM
ncbi:MAG: hypothetical protein IJX29_04185 [Bacteroides sp.]|nr:hypothetical protein [Bacteroides sp.]